MIINLIKIIYTFKKTFNIVLLFLLLTTLFACGREAVVEEQNTTGSTTGSGSATLTWVAPTTNVDGTSLSNLAGYKVYYGISSGSYTTRIDVGNVTTYTVTGLSVGTYYFAVTAYNATGDESDFSSEVNKSL